MKPGSNTMEAIKKYFEKTPLLSAYLFGSFGLYTGNQITVFLNENDS